MKNMKEEENRIIQSSIYKNPNESQTAQIKVK